MRGGICKQATSPCCLLQGLPQDASPAAASLYALVLAMTGLFITWAGTACNNPIFAGGCGEVYGFDRSQRALPVHTTPPQSGLQTLIRAACSPAEIVPPQNRNLIFAFDRSFEGSVAAFAAPLVGWLSQAAFGFAGAAEVGPDPEENQARARALGR